MPVVACPSCGKPVTLPDQPAAARYGCPHCRKPVNAIATTPAKQPAPLEFEDAEPDAPSYGRYRPRSSGGPSWFGMFTANLAGTFLAGVLLLVGVRMYLHWSVADSIQKVNQRMSDRK